MSAEAYSVQFDMANYHAPISPELNRGVVKKEREKGIQENLVRYVGEYRLGVKFDQYFYESKKDQLTGEEYLGTSEGPIRDIYRNSISDRDSKGLSVRREVAECLGFEVFEKEMLERPVGSMAVWVSPPGETEDGYGGYSFTFLAQSEEGECGKKIRMIPYRNELAYDQHNKILSEVTGSEIGHETDVQFLSSPVFIEPTDSIKTPEDILKTIGENEKLENEWYEDFTEKAWPLIQGYIYLVKNFATDQELIKARNALENFAIAYSTDKNVSVWGGKTNFIDTIDGRKESLALEGFVGNQIEVWGREKPPVALGSCGKTGELVSFGPMSLESSAVIPMQFQQQFGGGEARAEDDPNLCKCGGDKAHFHCPGKKDGKNCRSKIIVGKGITKCSNCGEGKKC